MFRDSASSRCWSACTDSARSMPHLPGVPSVMLDMQYRMLPSISAFPNRSFYHGNIRDSQERTASQEGSTKSPVVFIHHEGAEERSRHSILNVSEAEIIVQVVNKLVSEDRQDPASVGVISAYAAQAARLKVCMRKALGEAADMVEISTVDGFQGREKHTIILSTVRSNTTGTIGFLSDARRLNVALTRAQERLFVIGNHHTLSRIDIWRPKQHVYVDYLEWLQQVRVAWLGVFLQPQNGAETNSERDC